MSDTVKTTKTTETTEATVDQKPTVIINAGSPSLPPVSLGPAAPNLPMSVFQLDRARIEKGIWYYLTLGIRGLLGSKKGALCLIILSISAVALFLGKLTGETFVASITVASGIYTVASTAVDIRNGGGNGGNAGN